MNILFFVESGLGVGSLLTQQALELHKQFKNLFIAGSNLEQEEGLIRKIQNQDIPYLALEGMENHKFFLKHAKLLAEFININQINIVHVQTNWELALIEYLKLTKKIGNKVKIIYTIHAYRNNYKYKKIIAKILITLELKLFADRVICTTDYMINEFKFIKNKISKIYLGIDNRFFTNVENIKIDSLQLVYAARFRNGKNQDLLIKAFAEYCNKNGDTSSCLHLPGSGETLEEMKKLVVNLNMTNQVKFYGLLSVDKIKELYNKCNIGIVYSSSETFGQCIVEPFVMGRCVISTKVGIAGEIIRNGKTGFIFNNTDDLLRILQYISDNKELLKSISSNAIKLKDEFTWNTVTQQYLRMLKVL